MQPLFFITKKNSFLILVLLISSFSLLSCKKYLNDKPDKSLVVPKTIADFQALLDNTNELNHKSPSWDIASADNYYLPPSEYNTLTNYERKAYIWEDDPHDDYSNDWSYIYDVVYRANIALQGIKEIKSDISDKEAMGNVKGTALFFRALSFLRAAFSFAPAYDEKTAATDYGVVLKTDPDFNIKSTRSTVKGTYDMIISDLNEAAPLLPITPLHVERPSRPAAYALLARAYLSMRIYDSCFKYANLCLQLKSDLMDYNTDVNLTSNTRPISQFNKEVIFSSIIGTYIYMYPTIERVDSVLYNTYLNDDLRKAAFFRSMSDGGFIFKGTYDGSYTEMFVGIASDEVWLMRAECNARLGDKYAALADLNTVLQKRFKTGTFIPLTAATPDDALQLILKERRKELLFRGLRWMDLKRLNLEGANITLKRIIDGQTYTLPPNDPRYAHLIPVDIINLTGMPQNPR